jgi:hypothetical protein
LITKDFQVETACHFGHPISARIEQVAVSNILGAKSERARQWGKKE